MLKDLPSWLYFLIVASAEATFIFLFSVLYTLFSFLAFGEGNNSFMYTPTNMYIEMIIQFGVPTAINVLKFIKYRNSNRSRAIIFGIIQLMVVAVLIWEL